MTASGAAFQVSVHTRGPWVVVAVSGEVDYATGPELSQQLEPVIDRDERPRLAVDLSGVEFFDSSGLRCLVMAYNSVRRKAGQLLLLHPPAKIVSRVQIAGLSGLLPAVDELPAS